MIKGAPPALDLPPCPAGVGSGPSPADPAVLGPAVVPLPPPDRAAAWRSTRAGAAVAAIAAAPSAASGMGASPAGGTARPYKGRQLRASQGAMST